MTKSMATKKKKLDAPRPGRPTKDSVLLHIKLRRDLSERLEALVDVPRPTKTEIVEAALERELRRREKAS